MHNYTVLVSPRKISKSEDVALYLHCQINRERSRLNLYLKVPDNLFCRKRQRLLGRDDDHINIKLDAFVERAKAIFRKAVVENKPLSKVVFEKAFLNEALGQDFIAFSKANVEARKRDLCESTVIHYKKAVRYLEQYVGEGNRVNFVDLDLSFVRGFDAFLKSQKIKTGENKGKFLAVNTISVVHKKVSKLINEAIELHDLSLKNPYGRFPIQWQQTEREFLTIEELQKLVKLYDLRSDLNLPAHLCETLRMFLFMVGTGLRISDAGRLRDEHILNNAIKIRVQKSARHKLEQTFPMSEFAKRFLPADLSGKLFSYKTSQQLNENLKEVARYLGIRKTVTSHVARHTFGTLFILAGGKVEALQKLLGHSDLKTTMVYVHMTKEFERSQLKMFDEFIKI